MKNKSLAIFHSIWSIGLVVFVCIGMDEFKLVPMLAVTFMAAGINYSIYIFFKAIPLEKSKPNYMNPFNKFEDTVKIAKPLRIIGLVFFMFQMILWLDIIEFEYDRYVFLFVVIPLLCYIFLAIGFHNRGQQS